MPAEQCLHLRLVNEVLPLDELEGRVETVARSIADAPAGVPELVKRMVNWATRDQGRLTQQDRQFDVDTAHWRASIDALAKLNPRFIIPGHGQPSTNVASAIAFTRDYLDFVRGQMTVAVQKWTDFETAYKAVDWSPYKNVPAFDFTNKGNAYRVYLEMEHSSFDSAH